MRLTRICQRDRFPRPITKVSPEGRYNDNQRRTHRPNNYRPEDCWCLVRRPTDVAEWLGEEAGRGHGVLLMRLNGGVNLLER